MCLCVCVCVCVCACVCVCVCVCILLAEHEGKVVLCLILVSQVFETAAFQQAHETLVVYGALCL